MSQETTDVEARLDTIEQTMDELRRAQEVEQATQVPESLDDMPLEDLSLPELTESFGNPEVGQVAVACGGSSCAVVWN